MKANVLVSVVIPVYNVEKYLEDCIRSVINQLYSNLEIILVDDGSKDNSGAICDSYIEKDDRIFVIHQKNGGLSAARNAGIRAAHGDFICFIDSDDYIDERMIRDLLAASVNAGAGISCCGYVDSDENGIIDKNGKSLKLKSGIVESKEFEKSLFSGEPTNNIVWNKLYAAEIFNDLLFREGKINEDEFFTYRAVRKSEKIALIEGQYYIHRMVSTSIMHTAYSVKNFDKTEALMEKMQFYAENNEWYLAGKTVLQFCTTMNIIKSRLLTDDDPAHMKYKDYMKTFTEFFKAHKEKFSKEVKYSVDIFLINPKLYNSVRKTVKSIRK